MIPNLQKQIDDAIETDISFWKERKNFIRVGLYDVCRFCLFTEINCNCPQREPEQIDWLEESY